MVAATYWLICGLGMLLVSGVVGDAIFDPHPLDFSFRVFSCYAATGIMLVTACVCLNKS